MWYCKIVNGAINCFVKTEQVPWESDLIPLPDGLTPESVKFVNGELIKDPEFDAAKTAQAWSALRTQRNILLSQSDWTQLPNGPLSSDKVSAWASYRQALRDLPSGITNPTDLVSWPTPPQ